MVKANAKVILGKKKAQTRVIKAKPAGGSSDAAETTESVNAISAVAAPAISKPKKIKGGGTLVTSDYVVKELTRVQKKNLKAKQKADVLPANSEPEIHLEPIRRSDDPTPRRGRWRNKQRILLFASRGISHQGRHIMEDLRHLLPHTKKESKMDKRDTWFAINEIAEMKNCNKCMFFEGRRFDDIYLWVSTIPEGPSAKFLMENMNTMDELKFTGNCLKGSRAILSFDAQFDTEPHLKLLRELFTQTFGTPYQHPKSQPFIDHVFTFTVLDNRIWFRNFQIMEEDGSLVEIGPRFTLNPIRIFDGSFNGSTLWSNKNYISPGKYRAMIKRSGAGKYMNKVQQKLEYERNKPKSSYKLDPSDEIFHVDPATLKK